MMQLNNTYSRDDFLQFLEENFLTDSYTNWWKQRACRKQEIC